jgi:hypothetical protein
MRCSVHPLFTAATRIFHTPILLRVLPPKSAVPSFLPFSRSVSQSKSTAPPRIIPAHSRDLIEMSDAAPRAQAALPVITLTSIESALFSQLKEFVAHKNSSGLQPLPSLARVILS